jgi:hypothetical protein
MGSRVSQYQRWHCLGEGEALARIMAWLTVAVRWQQDAAMHHPIKDWTKVIAFGVRI